ncbi:hypothetical protein FALBO_4444 [Fusarium albosuccineum]|uniref:Uncharacterized protein n=1 Tax=Fusarium albosuccineum TaxID=1237068 RepID=A0A8H4LHY5_9HYPO|nr:hypothetical protein FALBO_4444 [Fusarium albosuccineum]
MEGVHVTPAGQALVSSLLAGDIGTQVRQPTVRAQEFIRPVSKAPDGPTDDGEAWKLALFEGAEFEWERRPGGRVGKYANGYCTVASLVKPRSGLGLGIPRFISWQLRVSRLGTDVAAEAQTNFVSVAGLHLGAETGFSKEHLEQGTEEAIPASPFLLYRAESGSNNQHRSF